MPDDDKGSYQRSKNARRQKVGRGGFGGRGAFNRLQKNKSRARLYNRNKSSDDESPRRETGRGGLRKGTYARDSPRRGRDRRGSRSMSRSPGRARGRRRSYDDDYPGRGRGRRGSFENSRERSREGSGERRRRPGPRVRDGPRGGQSRRSFEEYKKKPKYWRQSPDRTKSRDKSQRREPNEESFKNKLTNKKKKNSVHPTISAKKWKDPEVFSDVPNESDLDRAYSQLPKQEYSPDTTKERLEEAKEIIRKLRRSRRKGHKDSNDISETELDDIYKQLNEEALPEDAKKKYTEAKRRAYGSEESEESEEDDVDPTQSELERDYANVDQNELWDKVLRQRDRPLDEKEMLKAIKVRDKAEYLKKRAEEKRKKEEEKEKSESSKQEARDETGRTTSDSDHNGHVKDFLNQDEELVDKKDEKPKTTITETEWDEFLREQVYNENKQDSVEALGNTRTDSPLGANDKEQTTSSLNLSESRKESAQKTIESGETTKEIEEVMGRKKASESTGKVKSEESKPKEEEVKSEEIQPKEEEVEEVEQTPETLAESWKNWVHQVEEITGEKSELPLVPLPEDEDEKFHYKDEEEKELPTEDNDETNPKDPQAMYDKLLDDWDMYLETYNQAFGEYPDLPKAADLPADADDRVDIDEEVKPPVSKDSATFLNTSEPQNTATILDTEEIKTEEKTQQYTDEELTPFWPLNNHMIDELAELNEKIEAVDMPPGENDDPTKPRVTSEIMKKEFGIDKKGLIDMWEKFLNLMAEQPRTAAEELRDMMAAGGGRTGPEPPKPPRKGPSIMEQLRYVRAKSKAFKPKDEYERLTVEKQKEWQRAIKYLSRDSQKGFEETVAEEEGVDVNDQTLTPEIVDTYRTVLDFIDSPETFDIDKYRASLTKEELDELYYRNRKDEDSEEEDSKTAMESQSSENVAKATSPANSPQLSVSPTENPEQGGKVKKMWEYFVNVMKERHEKGLEKFLAEQPAGAGSGEDAKDLWQRYINFASSQQGSNQAIENQVLRNIEETLPHDVIQSQTLQPKPRYEPRAGSQGWDNLKNHMDKIRTMGNRPPPDEPLPFGNIRNDTFNRDVRPNPFQGQQNSPTNSSTWNTSNQDVLPGNHRHSISGPGPSSTREGLPGIPRYHPTPRWQERPDYTQAYRYSPGQGGEIPRQGLENWAPPRQEFRPMERRPYAPEYDPLQRQLTRPQTSFNYQNSPEQRGYPPTPMNSTPSNENLKARQTRYSLGTVGYPPQMGQARPPSQFDYYQTPQGYRPSSSTQQFYYPLPREQTKPIPSSDPLNFSYRLYQDPRTENGQHLVPGNYQTLDRSDGFPRSDREHETRTIRNWQSGTRPFQPGSGEDQSLSSLRWKPPTEPSPLTPETSSRIGEFDPRDHRFQRNGFQGKGKQNEDCYHLTAPSVTSGKWDIPTTSDSTFNEPLDR